MADEKWYAPMSMKAGKDLSLYEGAIMTDVTANKNMVQFATNSNQWPIGVLMNKPAASGREAAVAFVGAPKVKLGGKVTSRSLIVANASGFGVSCATTGGIPLGRALYGGSTGDYVPVLIGANPAAGVITVLGAG